MRSEVKQKIKVATVIKILETDAIADNELRQKIKMLMQEKKISMRKVAEQLGIDPSNLAKMLAGIRKCSQLTGIYEYLTESTV